MSALYTPRGHHTRDSVWDSPVCSSGTPTRRPTPRSSNAVNRSSTSNGLRSSLGVAMSSSMGSRRGFASSSYLHANASPNSRSSGLHARTTSNSDLNVRVNTTLNRSGACSGGGTPQRPTAADRYDGTPQQHQQRRTPTSLGGRRAYPSSSSASPYNTPTKGTTTMPPHTSMRNTNSTPRRNDASGTSSPLHRYLAAKSGEGYRSPRTAVNTSSTGFSRSATNSSKTATTHVDAFSRTFSRHGSSTPMKSTGLPTTSQRSGSGRALNASQMAGLRSSYDSRASANGIAGRHSSSFAEGVSSMMGTAGLTRTASSSSAQGRVYNRTGSQYSNGGSAQSNLAAMLHRPAARKSTPTKLPAGRGSEGTASTASSAAGLTARGSLTASIDASECSVTYARELLNASRNGRLIDPRQFNTAIRLGVAPPPSQPSNDNSDANAVRRSLRSSGSLSAALAVQPRRKSSTPTKKIPKESHHSSASPPKTTSSSSKPPTSPPQAMTQDIGITRVKRPEPATSAAPSHTMGGSSTPRRLALYGGDGRNTPRSQAAAEVAAASAKKAVASERSCNAASSSTTTSSSTATRVSTSSASKSNVSSSNTRSEAAVATAASPQSGVVALIPDHPLRHRPLLVLDLDETLVHAAVETPEGPYELAFDVPIGGSQSVKVFVAVRPYAREFLRLMASWFEVCVFTASVTHYADMVIDYIDPERTSVHHRLYRQHCTMMNGTYVKELDRIGRPMQRVLIVDNSPAAYKLHPENGFPIESWFDDNNDMELHRIVTAMEDYYKYGNAHRTVARFSGEF